MQHTVRTISRQHRLDLCGTTVGAHHVRVCIMADEIVVSFHNSLLRESDLCLLDGPRWLNDKLIGFAFEYDLNIRW